MHIHRHADRNVGRNEIHAPRFLMIASAIFNWKLWRFDYTLRIIMLDDAQFGITAYGCPGLVCTFCRSITYGYCINYATF